MRKVFKRALLCIMLLSSTTIFAQTGNDIVLEVAGEKISKASFLELYQKNNPNPNKSIDENDLKDYLELFINYKLKIAEAKKLGLDTLSDYISEVSMYRKQLIEPYLNDNTITEALIQEVYDRTKEFVRASHILISIPANATPSDTLASYNKALSIRKRILKGEDFGKLAVEFSEDPSAKDGSSGFKGNKGDLGYFTAFNMIYPFESACYSLKVGQVSMPIRTSKGFHIIKLEDRIPAFFSTVDLAHIWVNFDNHEDEQECKRLIDDAYKMLQSNIAFDSVALIYSDDKYSAQNKAILPNQRVTGLPIEYIKHLQKTSFNTYTEPFETRFGWHIIMPLEMRAVASLDEQRPTIEGRLKRDERGYRTIEDFVAKAKIEYNFKEDVSKLKAVSDIVTDSVFNAKWEIPTTFNKKEVIFSIGDCSFTQMDMAKAIEKSQKVQTPEYIPTYVNGVYLSKVNEQVIAYADSKLETKYPELKTIIDEFRDGILIFSITDQFVWNKSLLDTIGLDKFYQENKEHYKWPNRADATIWSFNKEIDIDKARKIIAKGIKKDWTNDIIVDKIEKELKIKDTISKGFDYRWSKFEKGDNRIVDKTEWRLGISDVFEEGNNRYIVVVYKITEPEVKTLNETKGIVTSDYQEYLEKEWIKELRSKYTFKVYDNVFNSIR